VQYPHQAVCFSFLRFENSDLAQMKSLISSNFLLRIPIDMRYQFLVWSFVVFTVEAVVDNVEVGESSAFTDCRIGWFRLQHWGLIWWYYSSATSSDGWVC
jgi:hypothetical protein